MRRVLSLAARGRGTTHPNPMVGAVVVKNGRIVGEGWHRKPGEAHAETLALMEAGSAARGGILFVNLEPCDHTGRTGPCTKAIIDAGILSVIAACRDPHPLVNGKGFQTLRQAGIAVTVGPMEQQAEELNRAFLYYSKEGTPYVTLKLASTLDGRIAAPDGNSKWITGEKARGVVHRLRGQVDAILVGVGTILADDPTLTARGVGRKIQPLRIVLDPNLKTPLNSVVVRENLDDSTHLVISHDVPADRCRPYESKGVKLIRQANTGGFFPWKELAGALIEMGILHVLVEGGGKTAAWILREDAANRIELFLAPRIMGGSGVAVVGDAGVRYLKDTVPLSFSRIRRLGKDVQITADLK